MQPYSLHTRDSHDLRARGVVCLEHGVENPLDKGELVGGISRSELGQRVRDAVDKREKACAAVVLRAGAADL